ncbi:hypothetical protein J4450_04770 [Candidatus Micrarchaeota archaeon]|nr:hypothetical protein [Candidatus Micrarchaeota archaeon]
MTGEEKAAYERGITEGSNCAWLCKKCAKKFEKYKHLIKEEAFAKVK